MTLASSAVLVVSDFDRPIWADGGRTVVTIGAYDGLHLGHRRVFDEVIARAEHTGARSAVVTFDRHPASVVRPESAPCLLTDPDRRVEVFASTGVDAALIVTFDEDQAAEEPEDFVKRVLVDAASVSAVVVGSDFHFGRDRAGNLELLTRLGERHDFEVCPIDLMVFDGAMPISSTAIRTAVAEGRIDDAVSMLGRAYELSGEVRAGDQRGRMLGFPTANIAVDPHRCLPATGVYAGWYERPDGSRHRSAINIGSRPTFTEEGSQVVVEAHLIGEQLDLYGEIGRIHLIGFLRPEQRFGGVEELTAQLARDVAAAEVLLAEHT